MFALFRRAAIAPALLLLALAGCEGASDPLAAPSPSGPDPLLGSLLGGDQVSGYTLVNDPVLTSADAVFQSSLIGFGGGNISVLGHSIRVPSGAVSQSTLFTLTVLPTGYVEVDLLATVTSLTGNLLDVGSLGFRKPVTATLSYARATNVSDPSALKVLRVKSILGYGRYEVLQPKRIDRSAKTVTVELDHFSRYTLGYPN